MNLEKITAILAEGGFKLASSVRGEEQINSYAIVQVRRDDIAIQLNTVQPHMTGEYIKHLEANGVSVRKAPGTFRTLYVKVEGE